MHSFTLQASQDAKAYITGSQYILENIEDSEIISENNRLMCVILGTQEGYIWTGDNGSFHLERILPSWRKTAEYVKVTATRVTYAAILTDHVKLDLG